MDYNISPLETLPNIFELLIYVINDYQNEIGWNSHTEI
jgi:hypothetical protein